MRTALCTVALAALTVSLAAPDSGADPAAVPPKQVKKKRANPYAPMALYKDWQNLQANGCKVESYNISTPIEARVLRNTPYAIAGKKFKSAELTELFGDDGNWYTPTTAKPKLSKTAAACVAKVKRWENKLRKRIKIGKKVEAFLTRDREFYIDLRRLQYSKDLFSGKGGKLKNNEASWYFTHGKKCFYDGDCGGYVIDCRLENSKVKCEMVAAG